MTISEIVTTAEELENVAIRYEGFHLGQSHFRKKIVKSRVKKVMKKRIIHCEVDAFSFFACMFVDMLKAS
jgi:hypothetical protein